MTDLELIERWLAGDEAGLDLLVRRHAPWLIRWLAIHLPRSQVHEAEDLAQEVLLVLMRNAGKVKRRDNLAGYLRGVARRFLFRHREKTGRRQRLEAAAARQESQNPRGQAKEDQERLEEAIRTLPEDLQLTVLAYYSRPATYEQVAEMLGVPRATVQSRLRRAVVLLRERLAKECPPPI